MEQKAKTRKKGNSGSRERNLPGEDGAELLQPDGQEDGPGESDFGTETVLEDLPEEDPGEEI